MERSYPLAPGLHVLPSAVAVPSLGIIPANAYFVEAAQPYLVDTGLHDDAAAFMAALDHLTDVSALRWIYLTHTDPDHMGALRLLLQRAPQARIITTFVGVAKLQLLLVPVEPTRLVLVNPGQEVDLGDRRLRVTKPHTYDAAETTSVYDPKLDALFSSDSFGAPLPEVPPLANAVAAEVLATNQMLWASIDSPWIHHTERASFNRRLDELRELDPSWILSAHLPPAHNLAQELCDNAARSPDGPPYLAPDQAAFEAMLRAAPPPATSTPPTP